MGADTDHPTSPTQPLARFPPSDSSTHSRAPEFYGFVALTSTFLLYIAYVLWALLPDQYIRALGVEWYPNREWALLLPAYSVILVLLTYFVYFALAIYRTPSFDSMTTMTDSRSHFPPDDSIKRLANPYTNYRASESSPELYDLPLGLVNRVLYDEVPSGKDL